jgi:hypothetical protein
MTKWSWPNVKIIITTGVYLTRGPSRIDPWPSGPRGQPTSPTSWPTGQGLRRFGPSLSCHTSTRGGEALVGGESRWRPLHLVPNWPLQVGGGPIHPYKYPLIVKVDTTLILQFSTCNGSNLVVVAQAKPCWESRVESSRVFAQAPELVSKIGDLLYLYLFYRLWVLVLICYVLVLSWALMHA